MLENRTILAKTDLGREAITRRTHNLNPRQRALLISINGEADVGQLLARFGSEAEAGRGLVEALLSHGLVAPIGVTDTAGVAAEIRTDPSPSPPVPPPAVSAAPEPAFARMNEAAVQVSEHSVSPVESAASFEEAATDDWRQRQQRAGDSLHALMGAEADLLAMRLARARSQPEFESHFERALALVDRVHGAGARDVFRRSVLTD